MWKELGLGGVLIVVAFVVIVRGIRAERRKLADAERRHAALLHAERQHLDMMDAMKQRIPKKKKTNGGSEVA